MDQRLYADISRIHAQTTGLPLLRSLERIPFLTALRRGKNVCTAGESLHVDAPCGLCAVSPDQRVSHVVSGTDPLHVGGMSHLWKLLLHLYSSDWLHEAQSLCSGQVDATHSHL